MNLKINGQLLKQLRFGVEIETYNLGKERIVELIAQYFHDKYGIPVEHFYNGDNHGDYVAKDHKNRFWSACDDGSLYGARPAELVSPILTYDDIEDLQEIVRILRRNGAKSNAQHSCGVHIHVDGTGHTSQSLRNLTNIMASHEKLLKKAIGFSESRGRWTQDINRTFLRVLNQRKPKELNTFREIHYAYLNHGDSYGHYNNSRYYTLNLHAIWDKGTTEFRCFEFHKNLHAGELKAYIQLCLAMSSYAKLVKYAQYKEINQTNEKFYMKNWLVNMGLVGDEFKTCREMLLKRLNGDSAYRIPRTTLDTQTATI